MGSYIEVKKTVKEWFSALAADFYRAETCHTIRHMPESSWGLCRKIN
jgi:hypothetical protein